LALPAEVLSTTSVPSNGEAEPEAPTEMLAEVKSNGQQ
jgi:hypothetical protein